MSSFPYCDIYLSETASRMREENEGRDILPFPNQLDHYKLAVAHKMEASLLLPDYHTSYTYNPRTLYLI